MKIIMRDGSGLIDLKYLVADTDRHGNVRLYFRRKGQKKYRMLKEPGTSAFQSEYQNIFKGIIPNDNEAKKIEAVQPNTLRWLITQYYESAEFKTLGDSTRKVRRRLFDLICQGRFGAEKPNHGQKPYVLMEKRHVRQIRDTKAEFPEAANARVKALRQLYNWAVDVDLIKNNPADKVSYLKSNNPDGHYTWTTDDVSQFQKRHPVGTKARLALSLMLFTGVRRSDAVKLGPQMERNGELHFIETKNAKRNPKHRELDILPVLRESIDAAPSGHLSYLVTEYGKPFTSNGFGNWFRKRCDEAGLKQCTAHGLRKAGATIAAENGATELQLMSIYGWTSPTQAALYTKKANRNRMAKGAMHLLIPEQKEGKSVPLSGVIKSGGTKRGKKT